MINNKTLLYLASGHYRSEYEKLPYEKIILVDKSPTFERLILPPNTKVEFLNMEALRAIDYLKSRKIKIDCLVIINEGLYGGGALYPFFSDYFMGYLHPILSSEFLLVTDIRHYSTLGLKTRIVKMNWGFEKINTLKPHQNDILKPALFSYSQHSKKESDNVDYGTIFQLRLINTQAISKQFGNLTVELKHGSIWKDLHLLDGIGYPFNTAVNNEINFNYITTQLIRNNAFINVNKLSINDIITMCQAKRITHIGLFPWLNGKYSELYSSLKKNNCVSPLKISLYHLHKEDYQFIYPAFGMYYLNKYSDLFENLYADKIKWKVFEDLLDEKKGYYLDKLCLEIEKYKNIYPEKKIPYFTQIKMKFGKVKIHISSNKDNYIKALINLTQTLINDKYNCKT